MAKPPPYIVGIVHTHANQILLHSTAMFCRRFRDQGHGSFVVDLAAPDTLQRIADWLNHGRMLFAFGLQGVGSRLESGNGENIWSAAGVPFLCLHYDNPCYNPVNHVSDSPYVANFYFFPSFLDIKERFLPSPQASGLLPIELLDVPPRPQKFFVHRPIKLLFLKTGASLDEPVRQLNFLPPKLRDAIYDRLKLAERDPNLQMCDLITEALTENNIAREDNPKLFWGIAQVVDIYLRRKRAIDFVEWLKMQPGALIVGDGWDFIDKSKAKAEFRPSMPADQAHALYGQAKFICNTNPYGRDVVHERILSGLLHWCNVITDTNAWLDHDMGDVAAVRRFRWDQPLDDQLQPVLKEMEKARLAIQTVRDETIIKYKHVHTVKLLLQGAQTIRTTLKELTPNAAAGG